MQLYADHERFALALVIPEVGTVMSFPMCLFSKGAVSHWLEISVVLHLLSQLHSSRFLSVREFDYSNPLFHSSSHQVVSLWVVFTSLYTRLFSDPSIKFRAISIIIFSALGFYVSFFFIAPGTLLLYQHAIVSSRGAVSGSHGWEGHLSGCSLRCSHADYSHHAYLRVQTLHRVSLCIWRVFSWMYWVMFVRWSTEKVRWTLSGGSLG